MLRLAMRRKAPTPLGALARGLLAGAIGAGAQSLFFALTKKRQPEPTKLPPALGKPEPEAKDETSLQTVARRLVDDMMQRGPIDEERKSRLATGIHVLFGALWGGLYGLARESFRIPPQLFGSLVWMASDNLLLPAFRLAGWPQHYKPSEHRYAMQAHLVYGGTLVQKAALA